MMTLLIQMAYALTAVYPVAEGVYAPRLTPSDDGRYVSWCDVYDRRYRILDTQTGSIELTPTEMPGGALNLGGLLDVNGDLYARVYVTPCTRRATYHVDSTGSVSLYIDGGWLLGRVDEHDVVAWQIGGSNVHGYVDIISNETWHHGYYRPEFGGGLALYTSWGYQAVEYSNGIMTPLPFAGQPVSSGGGAACNAYGPRWFRPPAAAWRLSPAEIGYVYGLSDDGVVVCDLLWSDEAAIADLTNGELLWRAGRSLYWGKGITADGTTAYFGAYDHIERYERIRVPSGK